MLRLHDSAVGAPVEIRPRSEGRFSFYACGPTVYDYPHIGHGRAVLTWDVIRRYLEWSGLEVHHVANITDIDDKIIERARATGQSAEEVAVRFEAEWWKAMDRLGVLRPHDQPHATGYVEEMIGLIGTLIDRGFAYDTPTTVYFAPASVPGYGLLARQDVESLLAGARVEGDPDKRNPIDFALWKKAGGPDDLPQWDSPWGPGRPGWHTECVVMSLGILGEGFDLHGGGFDLMFPHHENERAQAVAMGHEFARHWVHHGFIEMGGEKMSKSLGNVMNLTDLLDTNDPRAYRLLVLRAHYRSPVEVTPQLLVEAASALERIDGMARRTGTAATAAVGRAVALVDQRFDHAEIERFTEAMDHDLDTPAAMAQVFELVRRANGAIDAGDDLLAARLGATATELAAAMGLFAAAAQAADGDAQDLAARLDAARAAKDFAAADALRAELQAAGWVVETTRAGTILRRV
jgi:cysteinyl-tRNA synthetase